MHINENFAKLAEALYIADRKVSIPPPCSHVCFTLHLLYVMGCLQCFEAVGWAAGRASGLSLIHI